MITHFTSRHWLAVANQNVLIHADEFISMNEEFDDRFQDFRSQESSLHMFSSPFDVNVEQAPEEFHMELIELQGNDDLKRDMKDYSLLEFYKRLPEESFPKKIVILKIVQEWPPPA